MDREAFDKILCSSSATQQDIDEFYWLVNKAEATQPEAIMEIGVYVGGSLKFWEQLLPIGGLLIAIDRNDPKIHVAWNWQDSKRKIVLVHGVSTDSTTIAQVEKALMDPNYGHGKPVDFIFIDATHDSESVRKDFEAYTPYLRKGGLVGFHDVGDCRQFFNSLQGRKEELTKRIGTGAWWKG